MVHCFLYVIPDCLLKKYYAYSLCKIRVFIRVRVARSLVFCVMFCRSLFVILTFFFWPVCCLFFSDLRNLSTPLVSSNFSFLFFSVTQIQMYNHFNSTMRNMFYKQLNSCAAVNN